MSIKQHIKTHTRKAVLFMTIAGLLLAPQASAQQAKQNTAANNSTNTLKVTPVRTDISIKPGETKTVPMTVSNLTATPITIKAVSNDFVAGDERGTPALVLDENDYAPTHSLKRFMKPIPNLTIPANKATTTNLTITVPKDTQAGGYFGAVRFAPVASGEGGQVNLSASVASLVLLTVPGALVEKLDLTDYKIQQNGNSSTNYNNPKDIQLTTRFENKGNVQVAPFGKVSVVSELEDKKVVYAIDFNNNVPRDMILPDSARRWDIPLKNLNEFGHYTVSATFAYGTKNETIEATRSFWVIPQWMIFAAIGVAVVLLLLIALITWLIVRAVRRRKGGRRTKQQFSGHRR